MNDNAQFYTQENVDYIDAAAAFDEENCELNIFVINRNWEEDTCIVLETGNFEGYKFLEHIQLYSDDMGAVSSYDNQDVIVPSINQNAQFANGNLRAQLKKLSWNVFRFKK
jgi:alpha-N-arabinofuranosidase